MPANQRQQTAQFPTSPTSKATAKYTNKDGSKFITVPKSMSIESSETSPAMAQTTIKPNGQVPTAPTGTNGAAPLVNRKKQKRREKMAAKLAAEQQPSSPTNGIPNHVIEALTEDFHGRVNLGIDDQYEEDGYFDHREGELRSNEDSDRYSGSFGRNESPSNGYDMSSPHPAGKKSKKKKRTKDLQHEHLGHIHRTNGLAHSHAAPPLPLLASTNGPRGPGISKEKIWNTSSQEERERIKEFWLSLGEDERKSLVKVEKDAVLKKMKEQQKHSCSCTVCGRKRTAIEEELEVLYDAYYEELEQYANHQGDGGPPMMPPPRRFGDVSGLQPPHRLPPTFNGHQPSRGRIVDQPEDDDDDDDDDDEYGEEEYSEDDVDEDDESQEEPEEIPRSQHAADFFNFGNSLTVQGGILTVADDLLKNDGKKFIEMMEQLAERRMAREEDARESYSNPNYGHPPNGSSMHPHAHAHNHPPAQEEDEYDDEDDDEDEFDSQDEDYDEEEMDTMTEEQRMEEGRRMFQIFAARMFEQRVLTAYKDKVAKERQQKLLEELEEESRADEQKRAKKAKDAQKEREKKARKKQALAEEKAKRDAEKAAEEAALRAQEEKKAEEIRLRAEEKRRKRDAQKKAEEEERLRKEAEKQRQKQEQRERQMEQERKQREAREKAQKEKEELRQRERGAKEAKEREARERREKQEKDKREKEAKARSEKEAKDKQKREEQASAQDAAARAALAASKRPPVPIPANLQPHAVASPHIPVATPAIPKAPTPIKLRTSNSQQDSNSSISVPHTPQTGNLSQNVSPIPSTPLQGSPGPTGQPGKNNIQNPYLHHPQATSPLHAALKSPPGMPQPNPFGAMHPMMAFQPGMPMMPHYGGRIQHEPIYPHQPMGGQFRPLGPNGMPLHPPLHQMPPGRGFPLPQGPPGFPQIPNGLASIGQPFGLPKDGPGSQSHSRHQSASFDKPFEPPGQAQPIARPAPIGRPGSVVNGHRQGDMGKNDVDDLSNHLGSSALLDDSDEPLGSSTGTRRPSAAPGNLGRQPFAPPFGNMDPSAFASPINGFPTWGPPPNPFGSSSLPGSGYMANWGPTPSSSFGNVGGGPIIRPSQPRSVMVRLMICRACKNLEGSTPDGYYDIKFIKDQIDHLNPPGEPTVSEKELLEICDTEGNAINGGGSFAVRNNGEDHISIRHDDDLPSSQRPVGVPGEIGSPVVGGATRFPGPPPGF